MFSTASSRLLLTNLARRSTVARRWLSEAAKEAETKAAKEVPQKKTGWWHSAEFWGGAGAIAGWGMSGAAIYDAAQQGPEVISLTMTPVLIVYSTLFARWAWVVIPRNMLLCGCHVTNVLAQSNQLRRALEHKMANGQEEQVYDMGKKAAVGGAVIAGSVLVGPTLRSTITNMKMGIVSRIAAADAGPFTVHFVSSVSNLDLDISCLCASLISNGLFTVSYSNHQFWMRRLLCVGLVSQLMLFLTVSGLPCRR